MPARVHAVIVARPEGRGPGLQHLEDTLAAVAAQTHAVDAITIVLCGKDPRFTALVTASGAEGVIQTDAHAGFARAVSLASGRVAPDAHLWLLAQDTVPEPTALERLDAVLELGPSVALAAPKLVRADDPSIIASLGVSMSRGGETVELAEGQFDQGQHDAREDVLGSDVRGVLLRAERRGDLLPDPALGGADEGLDMGVRARLAGHRVSLASTARIVVGSDAVAGLPDPRRAADRRRIAYVSRLAQLHRRLTYAPAAVVPLHILSFLPIAIWRALGHLLAKLPGRVPPEWAATFMAAFRWPSIARSRARLSGLRGEWWRVDPLRVTSAERREILQADAGPTAVVRPELRFFSGGGAWTVLAALLAGVIAFPQLLGWTVLGGGGLEPLRSSVPALWGDAVYGLRGYGLDPAMPADPFSAVIAVLGSISAARPSTALVLLWVLALPLATLGGWFAMTRFTERAGLRILGAVLFALAPAFLTALIDPRPTAVIAHVALGWLLYTGVAAHRSWGSAGAASILLLVVAACSPALGAVLAATAVVALVLAAVRGRLTRALRLLWTLVPSAAFFFPLVWRQLQQGSPLALLADPGRPYQGARASDDAVGRLWTLAGFPAGDGSGVLAFLADVGIPASVVQALAPWIGLLMLATAFLALLSLAAVFVPRWRAGIGLVLFAAAATTAALIVSRISVSVAGGDAVAVWPGVLSSAAWLALVAAAMLTLDGARLPRPAVALAGALAVVFVAVSAVPALTANMRGDSAVRNGPASTLPALVAADLDEGGHGATLVLSVRDDGTVAERVVWGSSDSLGAHATAQHTRTAPTAADRRLAAEIADLMTPQAGGRADLAADGIGFVLVTPAPRATGAGSALRAQAVAALDQNPDYQAVGETGKGALYRVAGTVAPRRELSAAESSVRAFTAALALAAVAIAVLLAVPTRTSVRAARAQPRLVGTGKDRS